MLKIHRHPTLLRIVVVLAAIGALLASSLVSTSAGSLQSQIDAGKSAASSLHAQISAETAQIGETAGGVAAAQARLNSIQGTLDARVTELRSVQSSLVQARDHLMTLENRLHAASLALSSNLVAEYEGGSPNLMTVILQAKGFSSLLNQISFLSKIGHQDANIVGSTRVARAQVLTETQHLASLETRDHNLTNEVLAQRNQVAALHAGLLNREIAQLGNRSSARAKLGQLTSQLNGLEAKAAAQARAAAVEVARANGANATGASPTGLAVDSGGMVQAPADAPEAVKEVIAAGNAIATLPYIWGGGHASFQSPGYDCSGSVSYALAAAGLLSAPLTSTGFMSYGDPGPGKWITIYATDGHAWMTVAGWRFDTVALAETGTRWAQGGGEFSGFVERHPPGL
jgi:peptidoglycan hydrolase CwlO-like protein